MNSARLNLEDPSIQRSSQVLYRCLEEIGSTKGALYLAAGDHQTFLLVSHYGWSRHHLPPVGLPMGDPLIAWAQRERGPFIVNDPKSSPELARFIEASENARFLLAPIYAKGEWIGLLIQRDLNQGRPFSEERDIPNTLAICQELAEALTGTAQAKKEEGPEVQTPLPVTVPPSETLVSTLSPEPVINQVPQRKIPVGSFLPEQRTFFWEMATVLFQVLPLAAVALWMEEPAETRPLLVFSRCPLSPALKHQIQATTAGMALGPPPEALRIHSRVETPSQATLDGTFLSCLPVILEEEGGGRDLLLLFRLQEQPFTTSEQEFIRHLARLTGCHLQEARLHERYHRAFLSVSQKLLGPAEALRSHSLNTAKLARNLALRLRLSSASVEAISISAILHDVGSLLLDPVMLAKGSLSPDEMTRVRTHPVLASTFLKDFQFPFDVPTIIRHHHERWDGGGYPDGLAAEEIPMGSRIIAIIEAFEVMTAGTGYRPVKTRVDALEEIRRGAETQFDPLLVQEFLAMMQSGTR